MLLWESYWVFFQIGLMSIGGGYASIPLIQDLIVQKKAWIHINEFIDMVTLSQITPGPIAINLATFVGIKLAGPFGAIVTTLGAISPSLMIVLIIAFFYERYQKLTYVQGVLDGLKPAVVALITSACLSIMRLVLVEESENAWYSIHDINLNLPAVLLWIICILGARKFSLNPMSIILITGLMGLLLKGIF